MKRAVFAGSFDPPTLGHLDIMRRASRIFDELIVVIAGNPEKNNLFPAEIRGNMIREISKKITNLSVDICPPHVLLVDFLREKKIDVLVRGLRHGVDFERERELSSINRILSAARKPEDQENGDSGIETVFLSSKPEFSAISSSAVRFIADYHGDLSGFIPPELVSAVRSRCATRASV
ncbi:MAG: pantetheine-phosphate adenylyltransferase [Spirochaetaceae bacterium]|jgi:pantetheine-phosphate adenylyltransferase|nr:pantetheine-phosphate adenylyltransferase [Spirochaetaceae bacterium]